MKSTATGKAFAVPGPTRAEQRHLSAWERDQLTSAQRRELARRGCRVGVTKPTIPQRVAKRRRRTRSR